MRRRPHSDLANARSLARPVAREPMLRVSRRGRLTCLGMLGGSRCRAGRSAHPPPKFVKQPSIPINSACWEGADAGLLQAPPAPPKACRRFKMEGVSWAPRLPAMRLDLVVGLLGWCGGAPCMVVVDARLGGGACLRGGCSAGVGGAPPVHTRASIRSARSSASLSASLVHILHPPSGAHCHCVGAVAPL